MMDALMSVPQKHPTAQIITTMAIRLTTLSEWSFIS